MQSYPVARHRRMSDVLPNTIHKSLHVVTAKPTGDVELTLLSRKIFNILLAHAKEDFRRSTAHTVKLKDLAVMLLEGHESIDRIMQAIERLYKTEIKIDFIDDEGVEHEVRCHVLSYEYKKVEGGYLRFKFDGILLEFLDDPKVYANLRIDVSNQMTSVPALKLYEMMVAYYLRQIPQWTGTVDELREYLEVGDKYGDRFNHFKSRILEKAIEEVSRTAEFRILADYNKGGQGGKVHTITLSAVAKMEGPTIVAPLAKPGRRTTQRVENMVDMFRGVSDEDLSRPPTLPDHVAEEATRIAGPDADLDALSVQWFAEFGQRAHDNVESFIPWIRLRTERERSEAMKDANVDTLFDGFFK